MGVRIARGLLATIRDDPDDIFVQVQNPSDFDAAVRALRSAARDIAELDGGWQSAPGLSPGDRNGPKYVTDVLPAGTGPFIMIDGGFTPHSVLRTIPTIVTRHLEAEGVAEAVVGCLSADTLLGGLDYLPRAVVLHAYRPPIARRGGTALPEGWVNEAVGWVAQGRAVDDELWGATGTVEFPVRIADLDRLVAQCQRLRTDVILVAGRPPRPRRSKRRPEWDAHQIREDVVERLGDSIRAARVSASWVSMAHGGPGVGWSDLRQTMKELEDIGRRWAPEAAGAHLVSDESFRKFILPPPQIKRYDLRDVVLPSGICPWQILGPGHLARLGQIPDGSHALDDSRVELPVGEPDRWLPPLPERARELVAPCLLRSGEARSLIESGGEGPDLRLHRPELSWRTSGYEVPLSPLMKHLYGLFPSVSLHLFAPLSSSGLAASLLERAGDWLLQGGTSLWGATEYLAHPLEPHEVAPFLNACLKSRSMNGGIAVPGPPDRTSRLVRAGGLSDVGHLQLLVGWPGGVEGRAGKDRYSELLTMVDDLKDMARELSGEVAYEFIDFADSFRAPLSARWSWTSQGGESPYASALLCEEFVIDAFHYQVLGPGHLARLGNPPPGSEELDGGRYELEIAEASAWLVPEGLEVLEELAPCLPSAAELDRMSTARTAAVAVAQGGLVQVLDALGCAGGPLDRMAETPSAVVLRLFPEPDADRQGRWLPESLIDHLVAWAAGGDDTDLTAWAALQWCLQFPLKASDSETFFRAAWHQPVTAAIVTGDLGQRVRLASSTVHRGLVLAEAGSADNTRSAFSQLCDIARAIAAAVPVVYAFASLDPTLEAAVAEHHEAEWTTPPPATVDAWRDTVPDVFPFQVLGRGHAERLGATIIGAGGLAHGAVELSFGDPVEWLPGTPSRAEVRQSAAELLAPLLYASPET